MPMGTMGQARCAALRDPLLALDAIYRTLQYTRPILYTVRRGPRDGPRIHSVSVQYDSLLYASLAIESRN